MSLVESIRHDGAIHELRLARPPVNALNPAWSDGLREAVAPAVADGAHGLVLSGGPKVFSAGMDVPYLLGLGDDRTTLKAAWEAFFAAARALAGCPVPVVAALAGHAPAGGCVLALCCDYRVMASGPWTIGLNETQVGLVAPEGVQHLLRRTVGGYRAERLLVGGELVDAERALAIGLVDELVGVDEVAHRAKTWLADLLALPRQPMLDTRAIARADLVAALRPERIRLDRFLDAWTDPDTQAGLQALVARLTKPVA